MWEKKKRRREWNKKKNEEERKEERRCGDGVHLLIIAEDNGKGQL